MNKLKNTSRIKLNPLSQKKKQSVSIHARRKHPLNEMWGEICGVNFRGEVCEWSSGREWEGESEGVSVGVACKVNKSILITNAHFNTTLEKKFIYFMNIQNESVNIANHCRVTGRAESLRSLNLWWTRN